ncbi:hypothetical protein CHGG_04887 [Chaetomium globosum CBS 148.51]|uniref:Uncharacterized protein n=1 Tax=Chaetomium globosum (strain ATCC 6205 / CBS 148.51 / DSM 1962 / NBRC 6347 / NRRL 1970) TaxID=306901 RepID=Q2H009_CHAGB|nr:uncharacterized protein CHGG_04887 [Chaetomium globosum CBS 148.51]EAQ88268.1 hypothetical protein CHGG_04887 [Chaetomium globosum CBS 148.51]
MADLGAVLGLEGDGETGNGEGDDGVGFGGVEVWVVDAHRPWNLGNVFGGFPLEPETEEATTFAARTPVGVRAGCIDRAYRPGKGGIVVFDDGDIEDDLGMEKEAYLALVDMPDIEDDGEDLGDSEDDEESDIEEPPVAQTSRTGQKRKSWDFLDEDSEEEDDRPKQRRRSNSSTPIPDSPRRPAQRGLISLRDDAIFSSDALEPPTPAQPLRAPSARTLRRKLLRLRRKNEAILRDYYRLGASYSEPVSSMMYSLASELGREDNDLLWMAIVGVSSMELYGRSSAGIAVPVRSADPRPATGWMGMRGARDTAALSLTKCETNTPPCTNLDELVPTIDTDGKDRGRRQRPGWGFVRQLGLGAQPSAPKDVGVVIGAAPRSRQEHPLPPRPPPTPPPPTTPPKDLPTTTTTTTATTPRRPAKNGSRVSGKPTTRSKDIESLKAEPAPRRSSSTAPSSPPGTTVLKKKQISHLRAFRMPWPSKEREASGGRLAHGGRGTPLVVASLDEQRGVYVVVGTGGGGGPDSAFGDREAERKRAVLREERGKAREEARRVRERVREEKRAARRRLREEAAAAAAAAGGGKKGGDGEEEEEEEAGRDGE